jgi:hypothetical protein
LNGFLTSLSGGPYLDASLLEVLKRDGTNEEDQANKVLKDRIL